MVPTNAQMAAIAGAPLTDALAANAFSVTTALSRFGGKFGMTVPHRLAHYLAQLCEESGGWKWDKELASGKEYEGRADLGNTRPGDGVLFKGRTAGQITGRANYRAFTKWVRLNVDPNGPDFEESPELLNTDPWEGLGPMWFWITRKLNDLADENDIEQITKKWNGGLNGFDVRLKFFTRAGLVLLGLDPNDIHSFQRQAQAKGELPPDETGKPSQIDGDAGPKTRAAIFTELSAMSTQVETVKSPVIDTVTVEKEVPTPIIPQGADKPGLARWFGGLSLTGIIGSIVDIPTPYKIAFGVALVIGVLALYLRGEQIAARTKTVLKAFES